MQINTQNIQRPQLFTEFFTEVLLWNSEFLTFIKTTTQKTIKTVTSTIHNNTIKTKSQLKSELKKLSKLSEKLFISYSDNEEECKKVDKEIAQIYMDYKDAPE